MENFLHAVQQFLAAFPGGIWGFVLASYALSLTLICLVVVWLPEDYLLDESRWYKALKQRNPLLYWVIFLLKNLLGLVFLLLGVLMSVLPGPGALMFLVAFLLLDFPGKHKIMIWLLSKPSLLKTINRIRRWWGKPPLCLPQELQSG
jgi:hypothetical protein